jgi:DNA (cytosine-5)-methyltransferase 1
LRAGADHTDLPAAMRMDLANRKSEILKSHGIFARINGNGQFKTAMTTVAPNAKGGVLLHPSQKRIITVRECARAQGFPDRYKFLSINKEPHKIIQDQHRQIGNAVPVPMAIALGKVLGDALIKLWEMEDSEGSQEA